jgi:hypothetical protein
MGQGQITLEWSQRPCFELLAATSDLPSVPVLARRSPKITVLIRPLEQDIFGLASPAADQGAAQGDGFVVGQGTDWSLL